MLEVKQMEQKSTKVIRSSSPINYSYATIKITQSRLDKGLIAIPVALAESFPDHNEDVQVFLDNSPASQTKHYCSYTSSAGENRILGVTEWFRQNNIKRGDEIVIQFIDKERFIYRLIPERNFVSETKQLESGLDSSENEQDALEKITTLAHWTHLNEEKVVASEYLRLVNAVPIVRRRYVERSASRVRENVPANLRTLLRNIYQGHCQVCDFWFLKRDAQPYFETHHLDPSRGHHPKNVLVVCGNCHNQFEHANLKHEFNDDQWLTKVCFNERTHPVKQAVLSMKVEGFFKELFV